MSDLNWSAFEPLLYVSQPLSRASLTNRSSMLHHSNVDRLVAMWQTIHYDDAIFTGTANSTGQYATLKDSPVTADSPLKPFFTSNMTFHTSRSVANITAFGYTYPEMPDWAMPPEARANHVRAQVNSLYSGRGANGVGLTRAAALSLNTNKAGGIRPQSKSEPQPKNNYYYTAEIAVDRSELALPAMLRLVVGGRVVGRLSLLAMPREGTVAVSLPLRDVLIGNRSVRDFPVGKVVLFLQRELKAEIWAVRSLP